MSALPSPLPVLPGQPPAIELVPLFRGCWRLRPYVRLPRGPIASRVILEMSDGRLEGRGVSARVRHRANADWLLVGPDGIGTADWRGTFETDDARYRWLNVIHSVFRGVVEGDEAAGQAVYYDEYFEVR